LAKDPKENLQEVEDKANEGEMLILRKALNRKKSEKEE